MIKRNSLVKAFSIILAITNICQPFGMSVYAKDSVNSFTEEGTAQLKVLCEVDASYKVILPASISLISDTSKDGYNYGAEYKAGVIGNVPSDKYVIVKPANLDKFELSDAANVRCVTPNVTQLDVSWESAELGDGDFRVDKQGDMYADIKLAGNYYGEAEFEYYLSDEDEEGVGKKADIKMLLEGSEIENGGNIYLGAEKVSLNLSMSIDDEDVNLMDVASFETTNENIYVDEDGDLIVSSKAKAGESATITAQVDTDLLKSASAVSLEGVFVKSGLMLNASAAECEDFEFTVTLIDLVTFTEYSTECTDEVTIHPGDHICVKADVFPSNIPVEISWSKTTNAGSLTPSISEGKNQVLVKTSADAEIGSNFYVIVTAGFYSKIFTVKLDHNWDEGTVSSIETCTDDGYKTYRCLTCGASYDEKASNAKGHDYGEPEYSWSDDGKECSAIRVCKTDPTHVEREEATVTCMMTTMGSCTENGYHSYIAEFDNEAFSRQSKTVYDIAAMGHAPYLVNAKMPTCTEAGKESDSVCMSCGTVLSTGDTIPATGHKYGQVTYEWSPDGKSCTATRVCSNDKNHVETENATITRSVKTASGCASMGISTYTATFTNAAFATKTLDITDIPAKGHTLTSANNARMATCTTSGKEADTICASCRQTLIVGATIPATGHNSVSAGNAVAPTCYSNGRTADTKCSKCGVILAYGTSIPAIAHNYVNLTCTYCHVTEFPTVTFSTTSSTNSTIRKDLGLATTDVPNLSIWFKGSGSLKATTKTITFDTYETKTLTFNWRVRGTGDTDVGSSSVKISVDGTAKKTVNPNTESNKYANGIITVVLSPGTHTITLYHAADKASAAYSNYRGATIYNISLK